MYQSSSSSSVSSATKKSSSSAHRRKRKQIQVQIQQSSKLPTSSSSSSSSSFLAKHEHELVNHTHIQQSYFESHRKEHPYTFEQRIIRQRGNHYRQRLQINRNGFFNHWLPKSVQCHIISWLYLFEHSAVAATCTALQSICGLRESFCTNQAPDSRPNNKPWSESGETAGETGEIKPKLQLNNGHFLFYLGPSFGNEPFSCNYLEHEYYSEHMHRRLFTCPIVSCSYGIRIIRGIYGDIFKFLTPREIEAVRVLSQFPVVEWSGPNYTASTHKRIDRIERRARLIWLKHLVALRPSSVSIRSLVCDLQWHPKRPVGVVCAMGTSLVALTVNSWNDLFTETSGAWLHSTELGNLRQLTVCNDTWCGPATQRVAITDLVPRHIKQLHVGDIKRSLVERIPDWITSLGLQFLYSYRIDHLFDRLVWLQSLHLKFHHAWYNTRDSLAMRAVKKILDQVSVHGTAFIRELTIEVDAPTLREALVSMRVMPWVRKLKICCYEVEEEREGKKLTSRDLKDIARVFPSVVGTILVSK